MSKRNRPGNCKGDRGRIKRYTLARRQRGRCLYCAAPFAHPLDGVLHHYVPYALWPTNQRPALVLTCGRCPGSTSTALPWPLVWLLLAHAARG
ncbi:hypothetical protein ACH4TQ_46825 [Streptomyces sp. NPDC021218]|uniref:hypothetical protein n=1 Tax=Streptomyces sp. NPDC021218 TaxID=3365119 RepID=UPI0037AED303